MLKFLLQIVGRILACLPAFVLHGLCRILGALMIWTIPRRRRLIFSNLEHAFAEKSRSWRQAIARESSQRLFETGLLSLASPFLSERRVRAIVQLSPAAESLLRDFHQRPRPVLFCAPHLAYWESLTWMKLISPVPMAEFGVIFRPLDHPSVDAFIKRTRERFGMRLLSRKDGIQEAIRILRRNGSVGMLFDQNAGMQGALTTLFGRVCSTTELAGLLVERLGADVIGLYPHRRGFFRVEIDMERVVSDHTTGGVTVSLNRWLEQRLSHDDDLCASWLWSHDRWRNQDVPSRRLRLDAKRNLLETDKALRGWTQLPRKTRLFIRLPNWLGDVVMALPLLRAIRASRMDAELTLIGKAMFRALVTKAGVADRFENLPARGVGYWRHFYSLRNYCPDFYILLTNSLRGDAEAWLTGAGQRFGIIRRGRKRPLLTHAYHLPPEFDEKDHHQLELWEGFLRHFGLDAPLDLTPLSVARTGPNGESAAIGLIPGSENSPEKRWPVAHWRGLISAFPRSRFVIFGTSGDRPIADAIAVDHAPERVENLAGQTDLVAFGERLQQCRLLVCNDTGGMHLANALGVPIVALFGPTNPIRTGPVFSGEVRLMQPPGCPPSGGCRLADLAPETVVATVRSLLLP